MTSPSFNPHPVSWSPEQVERYWDFFGSHQVERFFSAAYSGALARMVVASKPRSYADLGCGTGELIEAVARQGVRCVGVDGSRELLQQAEDRVREVVPAPSFIQAEISSLPLADGSLDAASLVEVVEHLPDSVLTAVLGEARRVLRNGGTLLITTPFDEDLEAKTVQCPDCGAQFHTIQHVRSLTEASLAAALQTAGFSQVRTSPTRLRGNGGFAERLVPIAYWLLRRKPPHLIALATAGRGD